MTFSVVFKNSKSLLGHFSRNCHKIKCLWNRILCEKKGSAIFVGETDTKIWEFLLFVTWFKTFTIYAKWKIICWVTTVSSIKITINIVCQVITNPIPNDLEVMWASIRPMMTLALRTMRFINASTTTVFFVIKTFWCV